MKKRLLMLACVLCLSLITIACSEKTNDADTKQTASESEGKIEITDEMVVSDIMKKIDLEKCVTLGDYKGIALEKSVMQVTNDDVNILIQEDLAAYPVDVTGRAAQEGDTVYVKWAGAFKSEKDIEDYVKLTEGNDDKTEKNDDADGKEKDKLPGIVIAIIIVAAVLVIVGGAVAGVIIFKKKRSKKQ